MRPAGREVHDLFLVDAKHGVHAATKQQCQVGERAEPAIADQHIPGLQGRMDPGDLAHVVRPQRRRDDVHEQARPGVEQRQDLGDGEPAARGLAAGLTEVPLQPGRVGHGEARSVDEEGPMPAPEALDLGAGVPVGEATAVGVGTTATALQAVADAWNAANPDVQVRVEPRPDDTQWQASAPSTEFAASDGPILTWRTSGGRSERKIRRPVIETSRPNG